MNRVQLVTVILMAVALSFSLMALIYTLAPSNTAKYELSYKIVRNRVGLWVWSIFWWACFGVWIALYGS